MNPGHSGKWPGRRGQGAQPESPGPPSRQSFQPVVGHRLRDAAAVVVQDGRQGAERLGGSASGAQSTVRRSSSAWPIRDSWEFPATVVPSSAAKARSRLSLSTLLRLLCVFRQSDSTAIFADTPVDAVLRRRGHEVAGSVTRYTSSAICSRSGMLNPPQTTSPARRAPPRSSSRPRLRGSPP